MYNDRKNYKHSTNFNDAFAWRTSADERRDSCLCLVVVVGVPITILVLYLLMLKGYI